MTRAAAEHKQSPLPACLPGNFELGLPCSPRAPSGRKLGGRMRAWAAAGPLRSQVGNNGLYGNSWILTFRCCCCFKGA